MLRLRDNSQQLLVPLWAPAAWRVAPSLGPRHFPFSQGKVKSGAAQESPTEPQSVCPVERWKIRIARVPPMVNSGWIPAVRATIRMRTRAPIPTTIPGTNAERTPLPAPAAKRTASPLAVRRRPGLDSSNWSNFGFHSHWDFPDVSNGPPRSVFGYPIEDACHVLPPGPAWLRIREPTAAVPSSAVSMRVKCSMEQDIIGDSCGRGRSLHDGHELQCEFPALVRLVR